MPVLIKTVTKYIKERLRKFYKRGLRKNLPTLYIFVILLGLVLAGFYPFIPSLTFCSSLFGESFCTPLGFFISMVVSIPGYLIVGNILKFFPPVEPMWSIFLVILVSLIFYFCLGSFLETLASKKKSSEQKLKILILVGFFLFAFLAISFA